MVAQMAEDVVDHRLTVGVSLGFLVQQQTVAEVPELYVACNLMEEIALLRTFHLVDFVA